jgi:hypothetical protein
MATLSYSCLLALLYAGATFARPTKRDDVLHYGVIGDSWAVSVKYPIVLKDELTAYLRAE